MQIGSFLLFLPPVVRQSHSLSERLLIGSDLLTGCRNSSMLLVLAIGPSSCMLTSAARPETSTLVKHGYPTIPRSAAHSSLPTPTHVVPSTSRIISPSTREKRSNVCCHRNDGRQSSSPMQHHLPSAVLAVLAFQAFPLPACLPGCLALLLLLTEASAANQSCSISPAVSLQ